jgi:5-methylcytosine-specific restriction endonuclease McrA
MLGFLRQPNLLRAIALSSAIALEIDHIIPRSQGGLDEFENLQLLHRHCHDAKSAKDSR